MFAIEIIFPFYPSRISIIIISSKIIVERNVHVNSPPECSIFNTISLYNNIGIIIETEIIKKYSFFVH